MADPHLPAEPEAGAHGDDHGHGHGHGAGEPTFDIIAENSGADQILNAAAWLGFVGLLVFSLIVCTAPVHEGGHEGATHEPGGSAEHSHL
jgi:hypothetical protein